MEHREYVRKCKRPDCETVFVVPRRSLEADRLIGFSEPEYCEEHRRRKVRSYSRIATHHLDISLTPEGQELTKYIERERDRAFSGTDELVASTFDPWEGQGLGYGQGGLGRFVRPIRPFVESNKHEPITRTFPIAEKTEDLNAALEAHQVVVLVGTTGSGKSTYVPWYLLTGGVPGQLSKWAQEGPICVTQPRIQATRQVARFISEGLNGTTLGAGGMVGHSTSKEDAFDRRTRLIFKTDGKLINDIVSGAVANYSIIVIDEAHERSRNIDLILGLLKEQLYLYPHLRVIIASATIDHEVFQGYYGGEKNVPLIESIVRPFPIGRHFWGNPSEDWWKEINGGNRPSRELLPKAIAQLVAYLYRDNPEKSENEHILVFLPGSWEINQTVSIINSLELANTIALPLYSERPLDEQEAALKPDPKLHPEAYGKRRVVVSTDIAETSLTVEGVKYVIDSGYNKDSYWNPYLQIKELRTLWHSQAGCRQRWGRAGRVSPGDAYMLYTEEDFEDFPEHSLPKIAQESLEDVILTAKAAGVRTAPAGSGRVLDFDWIPLGDEESQKSFEQELARAYANLVKQGAIDEYGDLTRFGLELRGLPAEVDVVKIYSEAEFHAMGIEAATLLPFLNLDRGLQSLFDWDPEWNSYDKFTVRQNQLALLFGCEDDLELYLKLWLLWSSMSESKRGIWAEESGINTRTFERNIAEERKKLLGIAIDWRKSEERPVLISKIPALRALIAYSLRQQVYTAIELSSEGGESSLLSLSALSAQVGLDEVVEYQEYDEVSSVDESYSSTQSGRSGLYVRNIEPTEERQDADLIELTPTSVCFNQKSAAAVVACHRVASNSPYARTKVLGMNMIQLEPSWIGEILGTRVEREFLYRRLKEQAKKDTSQTHLLRLFLPLLLPVGTVVEVEDICEQSGYLSAAVVVCVLDEMSDLGFNSSQYRINARIEVSDAAYFLSQHWSDEQKASAAVSGFGIDENKTPYVTLEQQQNQTPAFLQFSKAVKVGEEIEVTMDRVLEDPLGRNPVFVVKDVKTGLVIPMGSSDFCGGSSPQAYFGRRFPVGKPFNVQVVSIDEETEQVQLSRGKQLLREYLGITARNQSIVDVTVVSVDSSGVYLQVPTVGAGTSYVGFVRSSRWPVEHSKTVGSVYECRFRKYERQYSDDELTTFLSEDSPLPEELSLGVELDMGYPLAFDRYARKHRAGDFIVGSVVDKPLDFGGLLVELEDDFKTVVLPDELDLDKDGEFKRAREYSPGESIPTLLLYDVNTRTKKLRFSIVRSRPLPEELRSGQSKAVKVKVLTPPLPYFRDREGQVMVACSYQGKTRVLVTAPVDKKESFRVGENIRANVTADVALNTVTGELVSK